MGDNAMMEQIGMNAWKHIMQEGVLLLGIRAGPKTGLASGKMAQWFGICLVTRDYWVQTPQTGS